MREARVGLMSVLAFACTIPNPAFDPHAGTEGSSASGTESGGMVTSTTRPADTGDATHATESDDATQSGTSPPVTSGSEGSSDGGVPVCAWPDTDAMFFDDTSQCTSWTIPRVGYLFDFGGSWIFYECDGEACGPDLDACTPVHEFWFEPTVIEPPAHLDGQCMLVTHSRAFDPESQSCETRWVRMDRVEGGRLAYLAAWMLSPAPDPLPTGLVEAKPMCKCAEYPDHCCAMGIDAGPIELVAHPPEGTPVHVAPQETGVFSVDYGGGPVEYELLNHRTLRESCDRPESFAWVLRETG